MSIDLNKVKVGDTVYFSWYGFLRSLQVIRITNRILETKDMSNGEIYKFTRSEYKPQWNIYGNKLDREYLTNYDENEYKGILEQKRKQSDLSKFKSEIKEFCFYKGISEFETFKKIYEIINEVK